MSDRFDDLIARIDADLAAHAARGDSIEACRLALVELERLIRANDEQLRALGEEIRRMSQRLEGDGR